MSDQVLCVRDDWVTDIPAYYGAQPVRGQVYTVNYVFKKWNLDFYSLWEFGPCTTGDTLWLVSYFRKCRPTDISCFKTKVREKEDA